MDKLAMENLVEAFLGLDDIQDPVALKRLPLYTQDHERLLTVLDETRAYLKSQLRDRRDLVVFTTYSNVLAEVLLNEQKDVIKAAITSRLHPDSLDVLMHMVAGKVLYEALILGLFAGHELGVLDFYEDQVLDD